LLTLFADRVNDINELPDQGIYLNDLNPHGLGKEMVLAGWQHNSKLGLVFDKAEQRATELENNHNLLDQWKCRGDDLLYSMIPKSVADRLRTGKSPLSTCESFDAVTIMFSELVGFNSSTVQDAMELVSTMNAVFSCFDSLMDKFDVYKVPFTPSHQHHLHPSPITLFFRARDRSTSFLSRIVVQRLKIFSQGGNCGPDLHGGQWRP
jgi:guanylate cyclase